MSTGSDTKAHWSFWIISIFMLIWNVMGGINFIMQFNPEIVSSYRETEQAIIQGRPLWATIGFGISVFGGVLGCIFLMLKRLISFHIFIASLSGTLIAVVHSLTLGLNLSAGELVGIAAMPIVISVFLVWFAKFSGAKGWVNI